MQLIADSGSTKTAWCLIRGLNDVKTLESTLGLNPHYIDGEKIIEELKSTLTPQIKEDFNSIEQVHFYGAGCSTAVDRMVVYQALTVYFPNVQISVKHDMLGAARALCQRQAGLVGILGTGSNSCYYDGTEIKDNISALGFMLGDEGGGGNLGRMLIRGFFYREMPEELREVFFKTYNLTKEELFKNVYHRPMPNRYIAGFSKFATLHRSHSYINQVIIENFEGFVKRHLLKYEQSTELPVNFIGSIGIAFEKELRSVLESFGLQGGSMIKNPMEGLIQFHK